MDILIRDDFRDRLTRTLKCTDDVLRRSIAKYGCYVPLVLWNGILVDGHRRYRICKELGIDPPVREMEFADEGEVLNFIDTNQLGRRNNTPVELAEISVRAMRYAGAVPPSEHGKHPRKGENTGNREKVLKEVADELGISTKTVRRHEALIKVKESLPQEIQEAVTVDPKAGAMVINGLANLTGDDLDHAVQLVSEGKSASEALRDTVRLSSQGLGNAGNNAVKKQKAPESKVAHERIPELSSELLGALGRFAAVVHKVRRVDERFYKTLYNYAEDLQNEINSWKAKNVRAKSQPVGAAASGNPGNHPASGAR